MCTYVHITSFITFIFYYHHTTSCHPYHIITIPFRFKNTSPHQAIITSCPSSHHRIRLSSPLVHHHITSHHITSHHITSSPVSTPCPGCPPCPPPSTGWGESHHTHTHTHRVQRVGPAHPPARAGVSLTTHTHTHTVSSVSALPTPQHGLG